MKSGDIVAIIVAIIGVVGNIIVALIAKKGTKIKYKNWITILFSTIFVICCIFLIWRYFIQIHLIMTYPINNQKINQVEVVTGKARNIPNDEKIWVVIYSHIDQTFYPNHINAIVDSQGNWTSASSIGTNNDSNKKFDIIILLANTPIEKIFKEHFADPSYAGFTELPEGGDKRVYCRVPVVRQ